MSQNVFPTLPGIAFPWRRSPVWKTVVKTTVSQREYRASDVTAPRYKWRLAYEFLRARPDLAEWQTLEAFFNRAKGRLDDFLFEDPNDNTATDQTFAVTDGVSVKWPLARSLGGYVQSIGAVDGIPDITWLNNTYNGPSCKIRPYNRTNQMWRSTNIAQAKWTKTGASDVWTANAATAPDGTTTASQWLVGATSEQHYANQTSGALDSSIGFTDSIFVKAVGAQQWIKLKAQVGANKAVWANFDVVNGVVGNYGVTSALQQHTMTPSIAAVPGFPGWYRIQIGARHLELNTSSSMLVIAMNADTNSQTPDTFAGTGTSGFLLWGGMMETGTEGDLVGAGRHIPTTTAAVTVLDGSVDNYGYLNMNSALAAGSLKWTGNFYWRVRFDRDDMDFEQFMYRYWSAQGIELISVKAAA